MSTSLAGVSHKIAEKNSSAAWPAGNRAHHLRAARNVATMPPLMCGIIGYIGKSQAVPILLDGLRRLEYRGYDSAGVAVLDGGTVEVRKRIGRIANLAE